MLAGFSGDWRPNDNDDFTALGVGRQFAAGARRSCAAISDPQSARVELRRRHRADQRPGRSPRRAQSAIDYSAGWTHQWTHGYLSADVYRQSQAGQLVQRQRFPRSAGGVPPFIYERGAAVLRDGLPGSVAAGEHVRERSRSTAPTASIRATTHRAARARPRRHRDPVVLDQRLVLHVGRSAVHRPRQHADPQLADLRAPAPQGQLHARRVQPAERSRVHRQRAVRRA